MRARLLNRARADKADYQILLTRYAIERFLYRLSVSDQRERFVLKGAMLFAIWQDDPFRPTRDLDLLGHGDPGPAMVATAIRSICSVDVPDDGVVFDVAGVEAAPIRGEDEYPGVRVRTGATIAGARLRIQIDVGFGDVITPGAIEIEYPTLLDLPAPILRAYPLETVVAEKAEAIVSLGIGNTRMKDFHDLWMIAQTFTFEFGTLTDAIQQTFERRRTSLPEQLPVGLSEHFALEREKPSGRPSGHATGSKNHRLHSSRSSMIYALSCNPCWPTKTLRHGFQEALGPNWRLPSEFAVPDKTAETWWLADTPDDNRPSKCPAHQHKEERLERSAIHEFRPDRCVPEAVYERRFGLPGIPGGCGVGAGETRRISWNGRPIHWLICFEAFLPAAWSMSAISPGAVVVIGSNDQWTYSIPVEIMRQKTARSMVPLWNSKAVFAAAGRSVGVYENRPPPSLNQG